MSTSPSGSTITRAQLEDATAKWYAQRVGGDWRALTPDERKGWLAYTQCAIAAHGVRVEKRVRAPGRVRSNTPIHPMGESAASEAPR